VSYLLGGAEIDWAAYQDCEGLKACKARGFGYGTTDPVAQEYSAGNGASVEHVVMVRK
jgi:hypothetical protein